MRPTRRCPRARTTRPWVPVLTLGAPDSVLPAHAACVNPGKKLLHGTAALAGTLHRLRGGELRATRHACVAKPHTVPERTETGR
eukprot:2493703-Prymnesium_polylepis.1